MARWPNTGWAISAAGRPQTWSAAFASVSSTVLPSSADTWRLPGRQAAQLQASGVVFVNDDAIGADQGVDIEKLLEVERY